MEKLNLDIPVWIVLFTNKALSNLRGVPQALAVAQAVAVALALAQALAVAPLR